MKPSKSISNGTTTKKKFPKKLNSVSKKKFKPKTDLKSDDKPKIFDFELAETRLKQLQETNDSSANRKIRKKIRQLEFIIKKQIQLKNTQDSLKEQENLDTGGELPLQSVDSKIESDVAAENDNSGNENSIEDDNSDNEDSATESTKSIKRFVVFVGNLPKSVSEDDLKSHFKKVGSIKSVRIPEAKEARKSGFAFIELEDRMSFEKTLSMHHTMLNNKRINVSFTNPDGTNIDRKEIRKKNAKFDAMRKAGLLAGSTAEHKKRSFRRKKKRLAEAKAASAVKI